MNIVFLSPSGELGGAETALLDMIAALRDARPAWQLSLVAASDGPLVSRAATLIPATPLPFPGALARLGEWGARGTAGTRLRLGAGLLRAMPPVVAYARTLQRHLLASHPDIVHSNGLKMHLIAARARVPAAKLVWHLHDYPCARPFTAKLLASQIDRCDAMLANSHSVASQARNRFGSDIPVHSVYNSIDLDRFNPSGTRANLDALAGLPVPKGDVVRVGLVATFARWKGHGVFLDALAQARRDVDVRGYVIGDAIYQTDASQYSRRELEERARDLGLDGTVGFTGKVDDVPSAMRALDIVVHASTEPEPFGLVIAEAMACGRPVIVSDAGGASEIALSDGPRHEPGNSSQLAERVCELARDAGFRASLGTAGRAAAVRMFSRQHLCNTIIPIYESLASSPRS